ncbi:MAG: 50S ribosomal protein L35 [Alphaproteobacteria bacterium]|nr:50S ribosomal protein L35 [Alphaproteobacteria bacterium]
MAIGCHQDKIRGEKLPKLKTKSYLKKRASMTATGKIRVARNAHKKLLRKKSARANNAGSKPQYLNENMVGQAKILAPYGLK